MISMVWFMVLNATVNNISAISWRSVLLVKETGVPGENHRSVASNRQTLSNNVVSNAPRHERGSNSITLVLIGVELLMISMVWFMVLNATVNNISAILWRAVSLVEETW